MAKIRCGYCAITADILHIGHIRFLERCQKACDLLTIGVMTDEAVMEYKKEKPIIPFRQRFEIVKNLTLADEVVVQKTYEFDENYIRDDLTIDIIFDSEEHKRKGADVYIPYMQGISSTIIKERIIEAGRSRDK